MSDEINRNRHRFFGNAAMGVAAAQFGLQVSAEAQLAKQNTLDTQTVKAEQISLSHR
jgi:hypothetical protein